MIKIYIINLERSVERRAVIINKMEQYDLPYEIFNAVDGINISDETMQKIYERSYFFKKLYGKNMDKREAGAALSHLALYEKIASEEIDCAVILEDDVEFDYRLKHLVENKRKLTKVLKSYDLVLLGYCRHDLDYKKEGICSYWNRINVDSILRVGTPVYWYWSAIGYLITNTGALKLLQQGKLPLMQADFLTANSPYYNVKLGLVRRPIIWTGYLNEISTIRDTSAAFLTSENTNRKNYPEILNNSANAIKICTASRRKYFNIKMTLKTFFLKLSIKKYPFVIEMNREFINKERQSLLNLFF